jgi:hypothetical protein
VELFNLDAIRADFPILSEKVYGKPLVYFDNAATLTDAFRLMGNTFKHASFSMDAVVKMSGSQLDLIILLAGCLVWLIISILKEKGIVIREALDRKPLIIRWAVYIALVMSVAMLGYISNTSGGFMYAQF